MTLGRTLCIFKPDLTYRSLDTAQALIRILAIELVPIRLQRMTLSTTQAMRLYAAHEGKSYYRNNIEFMTSDPSIVMVLEGRLAPERLRELVGSTDPAMAKPGTLRNTFGSGLPYNAVHASEDVLAAEEEIRIFFEGE